MTNSEIADILRETSLFYEMEGAAFKPAAYERAADAVAVSELDAAVLYREGGRAALKRIPGVGDGISHHIEQLLKKGSFPEYRAFKKKYPVDLLALVAIEDVGPKTVKTLWQKLRVKTVADLERAAESGKISVIPHFGKKTEANILRGIALRKKAGGRVVLGRILPLAERMVADLRAVPGVRHAEAAGSARRRQETVGDLDILVTTSDPERVMAVFTGFPEVKEVLEHGPTKTVVRLANGMHADVRVVEDESLGAALQYFTGSKEHNVVVRKMAIAKNLKLNEYGIWRGKKRIASRTEADVYKALGLPYMEPELRTDSGEIEAAKKGRLPKLIPYGAVRGDLQVQTSWTDGDASIAVMAAEAQRLGREYMAVTDHTRSLAMTGGLDEKGLGRQAKEIDALNAKFAAAKNPFRILKGAEVNVMKDGSLDIADGALAKLDSVGIAVHSHFRLSREEQTKRVIAALRNPHADILFHPTGRVIGQREPYDIDMEAVLKEAKRTGTAVEIDAFPERSDLRDAHVRMAVGLGVKLVIDTDAHHPSHLGHLDLGVAIARRGWATTKDVLNSRPLKALLEWLKTPKNRRR
jgi:DNA polymerase (family 10)